jgi:hypothetical protein
MKLGGRYSYMEIGSKKSYMETVFTGVEQRKNEEEVEREADEITDGSLGDCPHRVTLHDSDQSYKLLFSARFHLPGGLDTIAVKIGTI